MTQWYQDLGFLYDTNLKKTIIIILFEKFQYGISHIICWLYWRIDPNLTTLLNQSKIELFILIADKFFVVSSIIQKGISFVGTKGKCINKLTFFNTFTKWCTPWTKYWWLRNNRPVYNSLQNISIWNRNQYVWWSFWW